jgi:hypothetical protein
MTRYSNTLALAFGGVVLVACGGEGGVGIPAPLPFSPTVDASIDVPKDVSEASPDVVAQQDALAEHDVLQEDVVKPKRLILTREPFGNYARTNNLLLDGDFEWLGGYTAQYPWLSVGGLTLAFEPPSAPVSVDCRSGMRCAVLDLGQAVAGIGVRGKDANLQVSAWIRTPTPDCTLASISLAACFENSDTQLVPEVSPTADSNGWCQYQATVTAPASTPCVFVSNDGSDGIMLLDDVVMELTGAEESKALTLRKPSAEHLAQVQALRVGLREFLKPKPPVRVQTTAIDPAFEVP